MRKKTKDLLSLLSNEHSKASLVNLWSDISALTKDEFVAALDRLTTTSSVKPADKAAKPKKTSKSRKAKIDTPATRIVAVASENGVQDRDLQRQLVAVLIERGYPASDIPNAVGKSLEAWLNELMRGVPSAEVMEAAMRLLPKS